MKKYLHFTGVILLMIASIMPASAQKGTYLTPFATLQITSITNTYDFYIKNLTFKSTPRFAYGLGLQYNLFDMFGIETALKYANQGQMYKGTIFYDPVENDSGEFKFESYCNLTYFQVPLMLRFNSTLEEDKVYANISAGIQFDLLSKATIDVDPKQATGSTDVTQIFKFYSTSFVAGAGINIMVFKQLYVYMGLHMSKTIGDIENKSFKFDPATMPWEYYWPVSTKKDGNYRQDYNERVTSKTRNVVYGFSLGVSYKFNSK